MNLLSDLNESQCRAVEYCDGPQLVIAGAGSGKTRVLTYKIAYLIEQGMKPWNILALTFTNKAAKEMKTRIGRLVGEENARHIYMGTFHSIFARILRVEASLLGYQSNYTIYDEADARSLVKNIIRELELDDKIYKPSTVQSQISKAKNQLVSAESYAANADALALDRQSRMPRLHEIYTIYASRCKSANAMDFDDLLLNTWQLFRDHDDVRQRYADRFRYVLVDEYQDTNHAQQAIILQLTREHQRLTVVGDDAQSIYAFRGANIDNILKFQQVYPDTRLFKLEQNYRSTQLIVQAANSLIKKNQYQIPKDIYSLGSQGEKLQLRQAYSDKEEASIVCNEIRRIRKKEKGQYSDFAILYRTNAQSRSFEEEFRRQGIPYRIYGGMSFYQRKEIKDVIAYFRLIVNPHDEEAFRRIVNYPARGIGNTTLQKISEAAGNAGVSLWTVVSDPVAYDLSINGGTLGKLTAFSQLIQLFLSQSEENDAYQLAEIVVKDSGILADIYSGNDPESLSRQENLQELLSSIQEFVSIRTEEGMADRASLADYLQEVALLTDADKADADPDRVSLMTIHAAKGLEYPTVFVVGLEENILPSAMSAASLRELEEERRLLYVAITRAECHCILTCAKNRWRYGKMEFGSPSRFIRDIDARLLDVSLPLGGSEGRALSSRWQNSRPVASQFRADPKPKITAPRRPEERPVDSFSSSFKEKLALAGGRFKRVAPTRTSSPSKGAGGGFSLTVGTVIEHQRFGIGTVVKVEGTGENTKATIEFRNTGTKQLLLKFAKYRIVQNEL
ncbi:MAG: UvrD-helicase domain-containing protein [Prevotella sp.]|nr:UvrD-helicase domain-containing protein [Prevotella sp.]